MTMLSVMTAIYIYCVVPTKNKRKLIQNYIKAKIEPKCLSSILCIHKYLILFIDKKTLHLYFKSNILDYNA